MGSSLCSRRSARFLAATCLAAGGFAGTAHAQLAPPAPVRQSIDANGVDLFAGTLNVKTPSLTIGQQEPQGLEYYQMSRGSGWNDNVTAALNLVGTTMTIGLGGVSDRFTVSGTTYTPTEGNGSTLTLSSTIYTYKRADGTVIHFDKSRASETPYYSNAGRVTDLTRPSGAKLLYTYDSLPYCYSWKPGGGGYICTQMGTAFRIASLRNSYGYKLTFSFPYYEYTYDPEIPTLQPDFAIWSKVIGATATNLAATGGGTPSESFNDGVAPYLDVADAMGRVTRYRMAGHLVAGITLPGSGVENVTIGYTGVRVTSIATPTGATGYASSDASGVRTVTVTDPMSHVTTYKFDIASQRMTSLIDPNIKTTSALYDTSGRVTRVTQPEGNYTQLTYDARGNVAEQRQVAKVGSGLADIVLTAGFDATCAITVKCNQPNWTKDAKANQTDYTYDTTHGGVLTVTSPAPTVGAVRPQARTSYTSLQAYFDKGGGIVASGEPVTKLTGTSQCQTLASCAAAADEVKTTIGYGPQTTGVGNNLLPVSVSKGNGTGTLTATSAYTYDDVGNLTYVDGPLAGTVDTTRALYNADREQLGIIGPDPDGAGSLKNRAVRNTIDGRGLTTKVEYGTTAGQTDPNWTAFVAAQAVDVTYDTRRRVATRKLSSGATAYAMTQTDYYVDDRVQCVAQRMNTAIYGSLPASACTLGTAGSFGLDRISKSFYDPTGNPTQLEVGFGTTDVASERTLTYSNGDMLATLKDAENNLTTYEYDGFDRLSKTRYPLPAKGANASSTTDYELLGYDLNSNVTSRRLRDAASIAFTYDNLNRPTLKNLPGTEPDVTYAYDLLGRITSASQTGNALAFTYDALSRNLTEAGPQGTTTSAWDLAGRRTQLTYPGTGLYVNYDYIVTGDMTKIRENGATTGIGVLATFGYDDVGRRTSLTYGNGAVTSYGFDPVSRLVSLAENLTGTTNDQTITFAYNPASQIVSQSRSNDLYAWTGHFNRNDSSTPNGLNQIANFGAKSISHDTKGNITAFGTDTFGYSSENLLTSGPNSTALNYDPMLRLYQTVSGTSTNRFAYDGLDRIAEYDGSNALLRRYVHGAAMDEPIAWYEGTGTTDRRFFSTDERGSIVSVTDSAGAVLGLNTYDEYGVPGSANLGAFGYTGQAWLPTVGVQYSKARIYSPTLGRFLQTDSIGTAGGINLYAYVGNDPVNFIDPLGLKIILPTRTGSIIPGVTPAGWSCSGNCVAPFIEGGSYYREVNGVAVPVSDEEVNSIMASNGVYCQDTGAIGGTCIRMQFGGGLQLAQFFLGIDPLIHVDVPFPSFFQDGCMEACLEAGTLVATPTGLRPIEQIAVGDFVLSEDERTGTVAAKKVTRLIRPNPKPLYELALRDTAGQVETFRATGDHRWKVDGAGWTATADLKVGDRIETGSKADVTVTSLSLTNRLDRTYNLEVADWHTFMVGHDRAIVHNECEDTSQAAARLGYKLDKSRGRIHGQDVYRRGNRYISRDIDSHRGGAWKMFDRQGNRFGTYNEDLTVRIGN